MSFFTSTFITAASFEASTFISLVAGSAFTTASILFAISFDTFKSSPVASVATTEYWLSSIVGKNVVFTVFPIPNTTTTNAITIPITIFHLFPNTFATNSLYLSLNALNLSAFSALSAIFLTSKNKLEAIGTHNIATMIEADNANIIENAILLNTSLVIPSNNIIGRNTQTEVAVDAIIGRITSFVPRTAATSAGSLLIWMWSKILSSVTTPLSTSDPTASDNPINEIIFNVIPCVVSKKNVNIAEIGINVPTTNDALKFFKNTKSTIIVMITACIPELATFFIDSLTFSLLSTIIL